MTTILVPGFGDDERSLHGLAQYLARYGVDLFSFSPQPSDGNAGIEELAGKLAQLIDDHVVSNQAMNLVGFSMGGLICRYYLQHLCTERAIERLVTVATPHKGTWSAYSLNRPACIQMRPGSKFLYELNRDLSALKQINFTSIWSPFDLTVFPAVSSWLPVGQIITVLSPLHQTMLYDHRVCRAIADCLLLENGIERAAVANKQDLVAH